MALQTINAGDTVGVAAKLLNNFTYLNGQDFVAAKYSTGALTTGNTMAAGSLSGAQYTVYQNTATTPGTLTTRTATLMFSDFTNAQVGQAYTLRIINTGTSTLTIAAGTGVTLTGTMTLLTNTTRDFVVTFNSSSTLTIQTIGTGAIS